MPKSTPDQQRDVIIALLALDRYLLNGGRHMDETRRAYAALRKAYRGPTDPLLDRFEQIASPRDEGEWMAEVRTALEQELDASVWQDVLQRERNEQFAAEP